MNGHCHHGPSYLCIVIVSQLPHLVILSDNEGSEDIHRMHLQAPVRFFTSFRMTKEKNHKSKSKISKSKV